MATIKEFKREYARAVSEGYAAVFAGAGLSRASGYVDWKELVRPLAEDIGLDIAKESDLISIAQYFVNEKGNRSAVEQRILNEFTREISENENIKILTRLPIPTYWTTNYDNLIENALENNKRKSDIKITQKDLAVNIYDRDAVVYKMHGDVRRPSETVLIKEDYEMYEKDRSLFRTALQGELLSKTFLFIGFSFNDPNLNYILSQLRVLMGKSIRNHYCFLKKVNADDYSCNSDYEYEAEKQRLRVHDLRLYGIQAVELDSHDEITNILHDIERKYLCKSIFISGSYSMATEGWDNKSIDSFAYNLAKHLVYNNCRIVSGFGLGIGSPVINGALDEIMSSKYRHINEYLCLRPFPQNITDPEKRKNLWRKYREDMISQAGIAVFMFGNKEVNGSIVNADGMLEEFEIAKSLGKAIIPIGSTGGSSSIIYKEMYAYKDNYSYLSPYWDKLCDNKDPNFLVDLLHDIVKKTATIMK